MKVSKPYAHESAASATRISVKKARVQRSIRGGCAYLKRSDNSRNVHRRHSYKHGRFRLLPGIGTGCSIAEESHNVEVLVVDGDIEMLRIRFPLMSMRIRVADFVSLAEGALLNDTIIDFYLNHIVAHMLPDDVSSEIHVLPSMFWHRLRTSARPLEEFPLTDTDPQASFSKECRTYVNFWIEKVDIFDADFIVIPVIEQQHWMLVIVCFPSLSVKSLDHEGKISAAHCSSVVFFDSQQQHGDLFLIGDIFETVRELLAYVFSRRMKSDRNEMFDVERLRYVVPKNLPQQTNNVDCGLFILEYARCFLLHQPSKECLNNGSLDFATTYPEFHISNKRYELQKTILSLCVNAEMWSDLLEATEVDPRDLSSDILQTVNDLCDVTD